MMTERHPFESAPLGTPALEACELCGQETGTVLLKTRGGTKGSYSGPRNVVVQGARCEFCHFVELWCAQTGHDPRTNGRVGASKIVTRDEAGAEHLLAMVPFTEHEDREKCLADGTPFTFKHGMVLLAERDGEGARLVAVLKPGLD